MRRVLLPCLLGLAGLASAQSQHQLTQASFPRLSDTGPQGHVTLGFDAQDFQALRRSQDLGASASVSGFPLPGGRQADLHLLPISAMGKDSYALAIEADGTTRRVYPKTASFYGSLADGGSVFLGMSEDSLLGFVTLADGTYVLSSQGNPAGVATLAHLDSISLDATSDWCQFDESQLPAPTRGPSHEAQRPSTAQLGGSVTTVRFADVFVDADNAFRSRFNSNQSCTNYTNLLYSAVSSLMRRDLGLVLNVPAGYLRVWNSTPDWGPTISNGNLQLSNYRTWSNSSSNPLNGLPRDASVAMTSPAVGGVAYLQAACSSSRYALCGANGFFPNPLDHTNGGNWDLIVTAHELGHTFGSPHTFSGYSPAIACDDGTGPDEGTIMSYCHLPGNHSSGGGHDNGGISQVGLRYHPRVQNHIIADLQGFGCLSSQGVTLGDYDLDGAPDFDDYFMIDSFIGQGFTSRAAREALDMDGNGSLDHADRILLANAIAPSGPATSVSQNGSGVNNSCYFALNLPLMGQTWSTSVFAFGTGTPTFLFGFSQPGSGIFFPGGEVLVSGSFLFQHMAPSDGFGAVHDISLPLDASIAGVTAYVQGAWLQSGGTLGLCNRLDVTVSLYQ